MTTQNHWTFCGYVRPITEKDTELRIALVNGLKTIPKMNPELFKPDRFGIHFVSIRTGAIVDAAEVERITKLAEDTARAKTEPPRRNFMGKLKEYGEAL